jgi:hypothetical protein
MLTILKPALARDLRTRMPTIQRGRDDEKHLEELPRRRAWRDRDRIRAHCSRHRAAVITVVNGMGSKLNTKFGSISTSLK